MSARMAGRVNSWGIVGAAVLVLGVVLLGAGCATSADARIERKLLVQESRVESENAANEVQGIIGELVSLKLDLALAEKEGDYRAAMAGASSADEGAALALQYSRGLEAVREDAAADASRLMAVTGKVRALGRSAELLDAFADREVEVGTRSWNRFVESELPGLIDQAIEEVAVGLEAREARKKAEAEAEAQRRADAEARALADETLLAEAEARRAAEERAAELEAKLKEIEGTGDEGQQGQE